MLLHCNAITLHYNAIKLHCNTIVEAVVVKVIILTLVVKPLVPFTPSPIAPGLSSLVQTPSLVQPIALGGQ